MTRKDYKALAEILGAAFAVSEDQRMLIYDAVYKPLVKYMEADNEAFQMSRFSYAVAIEEGKASREA